MIDRIVLESLVLLADWYVRLRLSYTKHLRPLLHYPPAANAGAKKPQHVLLVSEPGRVIDRVQMFALLSFCKRKRTAWLTVVCPKDTDAQAAVLEGFGVNWYVDGRLVHAPTAPAAPSVMLISECQRTRFASTLRELAGKRVASVDDERLSAELSPAPVVDLIISTQDQLDLSSTMAWDIGFAEIWYAGARPRLPCSHIPSAAFASEFVLESGFAGYAKCRQNYGF